jgi:hypothetical protein
LKALIPKSPMQLAGPFIEVSGDTFEVIAQRGKAVIIQFRGLFESWCKDFAFMYCQQQHDPDVIKVIREATAEERKLFRERKNGDAAS